MHIELSESAKLQLSRENLTKNRIVKLAYDIEGCGCAVDGVVQLWQVSEILPEDRVALHEPVTLIYDQRQEVFFEDRLRLDYDKNSYSYSLKSDNQIYHPALHIINKTGGITV